MKTSSLPVITTYPSPESLRFSCRRILVRGLRLSCRIGAYDHERLAPQTVVVDCDVWVRLSSSTSARDAIEDVLNYDLIVAALREEAAGGHIDLQETLGDRMLDRVCAFPGVALVRVVTAKPDAYSDVESLGIETWRAPAPL